MKNFLIGGVIGGAMYVFRWPLLGLLLLGGVVTCSQGLVAAPGKIMARSDVEVISEPVQTGGPYDWSIAYRLFNNSKDYVITSMWFICSGVETEVTHDRMAPGASYQGSLSLPYGEDVKSCSPHYSMEKI